MEESDLYKKYKNAYDIAYIKSFNECCSSSHGCVMFAHVVSNSFAQERARISIANMIPYNISILRIEAKVEELMAKEVGLSIEDLKENQYSNTYTNSVC